MQFGKCAKCGIEADVCRHHTKYGDKDSEKVIYVCLSCHRKIHCRVRKEGKCLFTPREAQRLSTISCRRNSLRKIGFYDRLLPNVWLVEQIEENIHTGNVYISSYFLANNGKEIFYIDEDANSKQIKKGGEI